MEQYDLIMSHGNAISDEFIKLLNDYRVNNVNAKNMTMNQLYSPHELFLYLRKHHWKQQIPKKFLANWIKMKMTGRALSEEDQQGLMDLFEQIGIQDDGLTSLILEEHDTSSEIIPVKERENREKGSRMEPSRPIKKAGLNPNSIPSVRTFSLFKKWMDDTMGEIEELIKKQKSAR